jgi:hypothetical protein
MNNGRPCRPAWPAAALDGTGEGAVPDLKLLVTSALSSLLYDFAYFSIPRWNSRYLAIIITTQPIHLSCILKKELAIIPT